MLLDVFPAVSEIGDVRVADLVQNGLDKEALMLAYEMQNLGVAIDDITIASCFLRHQILGTGKLVNRPMLIF